LTLLLTKNSENNNWFLTFSAKTTCFSAKDPRKDVFFGGDLKKPRKTLGFFKTQKSPRPDFLFWPFYWPKTQKTTTDSLLFQQNPLAFQKKHSKRCIFRGNFKKTRKP